MSTPRRFVLYPFLLLLSPMVLGAQPSLEPRVPVGTSSSSPLLRQVDDKAWEFVAKGSTLHSRDLLLALPGTQAKLEPRDNSVEVTLVGNLPSLSTFAGLESAIVLHDSRALDLDLSIVRGRVVLTNRKGEGEANLWVRFPTLVDRGVNLPAPAFGLVLKEPGASVALEVYGRWPSGVPFRKTPLPFETPTRAMQLTVLKGDVQLKTITVTHSLSAPPGPASFGWDSVIGPAGAVQRLDKVPTRPTPDSNLGTTFERVAKGMTPVQALAAYAQAAEEVSSSDRMTQMREFAVFGQAALGNISAVVRALSDAGQPLTRKAAIIALRNFIGEQPGRDQQVFRVLREGLGYSEAESGTLMQLLHNPFVANQPETYQTLLAYLRHSRLAIRELAHWHLDRLTPGGAKIAFDAGASEADRDKAWQAWKMLLSK